MEDKKIKKLPVLSKLFSSFQNLSVRTQILFAFMLSVLLLSFVVVFTTTILRKSISTVGNSYRTNADLDKYLLQLSEVENAMESYMQFRTFESIDKYYQYLSIAEENSKHFNEHPSSILELQKEYVIRQLSESFFILSGNAIAARRANNSYGINEYLKKTLDCYSILRSEVLSLNMLYFKTNAAMYESNIKDTNMIIRFVIILMILILVSAVYLIYISISRVTKPLSEISGVALKVADRNFDVELFNSVRRDEIGNICRAFDEMIISIRQYIDTIWEKAKKENELHEKEIEMRALITEAHFEALQEQIKPHFLFNTLNTGASLAMMEGADKTCYFLEQVADFMRYNIQHPGLEATIKDEIGVLDNYIYIMEVRFGNRYAFEKDVDEAVLSHKIPNMIFQPLVENCIKHGLKDITENGKIKISVKQNYETDEINILISDNGCGFDPLLRQKILEAGNKSESIIVNSQEINQNGHVSAGLVNVISRLNFYFKRTDVFNILPGEDNKGTAFFIKIPNV